MFILPRIRKLTGFGLLLVVVSAGRANEPSAGPAAAPGRAPDDRLAWWREARFGMFIHWGPVTLKGTEISWSRANSNPECPNNGPIPAAEYDTLYRSFNPTKFDAERWAAVAKAAGARYVVLTAKHCDGFCLWPSRATDYTIARTPFGRDVCGELAAAVHRCGLHLGWYYSPMDWRDPRCRTDRNGAYVADMQAQLRELLTAYAPVDLLWFDTDGKSAPWDQERTYALVRGLQPQIVINNRLDMGSMDDYNAQRILPPADYATPEQRVGGYDDQRPWETCMTLGSQWAWKPDEPIKTLPECLGILARCAGGDGNLLLNITPMANGELEPRQVEVLLGMGRWLARYGESIYGTRGGPFLPTESLASTRKDNLIYVHVLKPPAGPIRLPALPAAIRESRLLGGAAVEFAQDRDGVTLRLPAHEAQPLDTVITLVLESPAMAIGPIPAAGSDGP